MERVEPYCKFDHAIFIEESENNHQRIYKDADGREINHIDMRIQCVIEDYLLPLKIAIKNIGRDEDDHNGCDLSYLLEHLLETAVSGLDEVFHVLEQRLGGWIMVDKCQHYRSNRILDTRIKKAVQS